MGMMLINMVINIRNFRNPYWRTEVDDIENGFRKILVCFDVKKQVFRNVPFPSIKRGEEGIFVDWNGSLGALLFTVVENERVESIDAWVFDDVEQIWRKKHNFGCIGNICSLLQCAMNGLIIIEFVDGKPHLYPEAGRFELLFASYRLSQYVFFLDVWIP
ncbi:hypothetical protein CASFOL_034308 [Castilleja foliolosa]|uniref:F-box associated beta-propeller type 3 domain-containing protein n=1 Tax=Castilleja foliolosa TaxID=1961234 RepID=A0ABD3BX16_9LAMI